MDVIICWCTHIHAHACSQRTKNVERDKDIVHKHTEYITGSFTFGLNLSIFVTSRKREIVNLSVMERQRRIYIYIHIRTRCCYTHIHMRALISVHIFELQLTKIRRRKTQNLFSKCVERNRLECVAVSLLCSLPIFIPIRKFKKFICIFRKKDR